MDDPPVAESERHRPETDQQFEIVDGVRVDRTLTDLFAAVASVATFDGALYVVVRFLPEYLSVRGVGPVAIGAFGTFWLAITALDRRDTGRLPVLVAGATAGVLAWLVAPTVTDSTLALWVAVTAGGLGPAAWYWSRTAIGVPLADAWPPASRSTRRPGGPVWVLGPLVLSIIVLVLSASFSAGFRIVLALTVALGGTAGALWLSLDDTGSQPSSRRVRTVPHLGDSLLEVAMGVVSVFVVLVVTRVLDVELAVLGIQLGSAATFGLLLLVEIVAGALARTAGPRLVGSIGSRPLLVYGSLVVAAFPLVLVSVPPTPLAVGGLFAIYGTRSLAGVARRAGGAICRPASDRRRTVVVAAGPLLGGVLFAVDPVLAFGSATAIGAVGVWELARTHVTGAGWRDR
ncbi:MULTISPECIES: hypothetical protein [Halomicrobium]|uniref:Major facilitator transporter n=2 Tax=Halomicrobium mukohataei TaxID=57705 RepID=C7P139_HALMD|nr:MULTISPECIES: hypothetical protein [Halomicrobium]ACV49054.1 major facilitator transporter [Halomicrobium mukohataei DSM 12286]QCD64474.1 hypothetical protein E5139_02030 [Halomicrobium mukohataei]QFR19280.1 hypothetical protein GBQ70_02030 [Halomicrobium sp. ZPS1]